MISWNIIKSSSPQYNLLQYFICYSAGVQLVFRFIHWLSLLLEDSTSFTPQSVLHNHHFQENFILAHRLPYHLLPFILLHIVLHIGKNTLFHFISTEGFLPTLKETFWLLIFFIFFLDNTLDDVVFFLSWIEVRRRLLLHYWNLLLRRHVEDFE